MTDRSKFRRVNGPDGTLESICMDCLLTVAIDRSAEDLDNKEREHMCRRGAEQVGLNRLERNRLSDLHTA